MQKRSSYEIGVFVGNKQGGCHEYVAQDSRFGWNDCWSCAVAAEGEVCSNGNDDYHKTTIKGELMVNNHRKEKISMVIRRRFSGELLDSTGDPKCVLREEGAWSVNKRNELTWTLTLNPGEEQTLTYNYTVLVN